MFGNCLSSIKNIMKEKDLCCMINQLEEKGSMPFDFGLACEEIILEAQKHNYIIENSWKSNLTKLSTTLSFENLNEATKRLPPVWVENEVNHDLLTCAFYALLLLDEKILARYEVGYILNENKVGVGCAGYSEKLHRTLPHYFTTFDGHIFHIDPIKGEVRAFKRKEHLEKVTIQNGCVCAFGHPVARVQPDGGIEYLQPTTIAHSDRKAAERERAREVGCSRKETTWQTTQLGTLRGSAKNIRTHSLIALMVYGLDVMKYALMEANSIFTIDHTNSIHDDNRVDNLALTTRKSNNQKKDKLNVFVFDYFLYFNNLPQAEVKVEKVISETEAIKEVTFNEWYEEVERNMQKGLHLVKVVGYEEVPEEEITVIRDD